MSQRLMLSTFFVASVVLTVTSPASSNTAWVSVKELEVPYILSAAWVRTETNVTYLRAKTVQFQMDESGKMLRLIDLDSKTNKELYSFPIRSKVKDRFRIDLLSGIQKIYFQSPFYSKSESEIFPDKYKQRILPVPQESTKKYRRDGEVHMIDIGNVPFTLKDYALDGEDCIPVNSLVCSVEVKAKPIEKKLNTTLSLRLTPKVESPVLYTKADTDAKGVGYYATFPDENHKGLIVRHGSPELIPIYVNVPHEMRTALEDAASYWNEIFGHDTLRILPMPKDFDLWRAYNNSIVFYPKDPAGGAQGIFSSLSTGQIIGSHIYVPGGFLDYGNSSFDSYVGQLEELGQSKEQIEKARKRFLHDYQVQTFAHEIGHLLGLRHNHKGSNHNTVHDLTSTIWNYIAYDSLDHSELLSSSLMDYMGIDYFTLMGARIRQARLKKLPSSQLPYDAYAIQWGYLSSSETVEPSLAGPYCDIPAEFASGPFTSPDDPECASWDEAKGMSVLRLELGNKKSILTGTQSQIMSQCHKLILSEAREISLSTSSGGLRLRKNNGSEMTSQEICQAVKTFLLRGKN